MFYERLKGALEALLFAGGDPLPAEMIAKILQIDATNVAELVAELQEEMKSSSRGLTITEVAGGYQLCTKPQWADFVNQLGLVQETKLSPAALETLAIIAFRQPVTRQDVEQIRGVKADHIISQLVERGLIKELGRKDAIGRPILYGTTPEFLVCFGLKGLDELPDVSDFLPEPKSN